MATKMFNKNRAKTIYTKADPVHGETHYIPYDEIQKKSQKTVTLTIPKYFETIYFVLKGLCIVMGGALLNGSKPFVWLWQNRDKVFNAICMITLPGAGTYYLMQIPEPPINILTTNGAIGAGVFYIFGICVYIFTIALLKNIFSYIKYTIANLEEKGRNG
jgi:hypothetical protein